MVNMQENSMLRSIQDGIAVLSEQLVGQSNGPEVVVVALAGTAGQEGDFLISFIINSHNKKEEICEKELVASWDNDFCGLEEVVRVDDLTLFGPPDAVLVSSFDRVDGYYNSFLGHEEGVLVWLTPKEIKPRFLTKLP